MSWLSDFVKPKIQALIRRSDLPDHLWTKCPGCEHMLFHRDLVDNAHVCHQCRHHFRIEPERRFALLFDTDTVENIPLPKNTVQDPLKFRDTKKYADRLKEYRQKTGHEDAIAAAKGLIRGHPAVCAAMDFRFMGGSMGAAVGQGIVSAMEYAASADLPFIMVTSSGGARMQEGIISLIQMPRTIIAIQALRAKRLPYIVVLTDPTTGGVSASFAMLGDFTVSEPKAIIGFAGARVIEETIRQKLPEGFQRAEYLLEHGMIDAVVDRHGLAEKIACIIRHTRSEVKEGVIADGYADI